uniref:Uncharacterized protein n=1 Tax=Piliocolobus tephrosceles TaxID=591936 RepID=A0A8C9LI83_9PRIM
MRPRPGEPGCVESQGHVFGRRARPAIRHVVKFKNGQIALTDASRNCQIEDRISSVVHSFDLSFTCSFLELLPRAGCTPHPDSEKQK